MGLRNDIGLGIFLGLYFVRFRYFVNFSQIKKQPSRGVLRKRCCENMLLIYRRTPMPKCDFNKVALQEHLWTNVSRNCANSSPNIIINLYRSLPKGFRERYSTLTSNNGGLDAVPYGTCSVIF